MSLSAEISATVLAREAPLAVLIEFAFVSATKRVWSGFGKLKTADAREWDGLGELVRIEGLSQGLGSAATPGKIVASGVSEEIVTGAIGEVAEFKDRLMTVYLQAFQGLALYGAPMALGVRIMKNMELTRDGATRTISINHEGPYTGRRRPRAGWYTDRDQQKRHPGDLFCERTPFLLFKNERWPNYV